MEDEKRPCVIIAQINSNFKRTSQWRNAIIAPGMVGRLWNAIIHLMTRRGKTDHNFVVKKCVGDDLQKMTTSEGANVSQALKKGHLT